MRELAELEAIARHIPITAWRASLLESAEDGDIYEIKKILSGPLLEADLCTISDRERRNCLHLAALGGHDQAVVQLLHLSHHLSGTDFNAFINAKDRYSNTP